jgi:rfaE bifunctional protein kinase chain/domain
MGKPVVIVGDAMLDVDIEGSANRLSPEAPVPVVDAERIWHRPGGAGLAAVLAARAHRAVVLVTALGDDTDGRALMELLTSAGVDVVALPMAGTTLCKTRIRAGGQSMLRVYHGDGTAASDVVSQRVATVLDSARAVCVADYGHGVTAHVGIRALLTRVPAQVPIVWDPHSCGAQPTPGCWLVTPNQAEAEYFSDRTDSDAHSAETLRRKWQARAVCITLGPRGALLATDAGGCTRIPVSAVAGAAAGGAVAVSSAAVLTARGNHSAAVESDAVTGDIDQVRDRLRRRGGTLVATGACDPQDLAIARPRGFPDRSGVVVIHPGLPESAVLAGTLGLLGLVALISDCRLLICGDTGVGHIATATGAPSVLLFGPTPPNRWGPRGPGPHIAVWAGDRGDPHADRPHSGLLLITVSRVLDATQHLLRDCA